MPEADPGGLRRRVFWLQGMSVTWTALYAAAAITAGIAASSVALIGLGLESVVELFAAAIVIWHLERDAPVRDTRAIRLIGAAFWASGAYLLVESLRELVVRDHSRHSTLDLAVAAAALVVMPALAVAKRRTGHALASRTLIADAAETAMCGVAAAAALLGVGLDAWFGWWWAVPAAGLAIAAAAVFEGIELWKDRHPVGPLRPELPAPASTRGPARPPSWGSSSVTRSCCATSAAGYPRGHPGRGVHQLPRLPAAGCARLAKSSSSPGWTPGPAWAILAK
jgi:hypothetical protein